MIDDFNKALEILKRLQVGKPIPYPAAPPPKSMTPQRFELPVPYALAEFPRLFLHLVKDSKDCSPQLRVMIEAWLSDFDQRMVDYITEQYGDAALELAFGISAGVMQHQTHVAESNATAVENDILADLEKSFGKDSE